MNEFIDQNFKVPEPVLRRLPWYLAYAKQTAACGETSLSSTQIAKDLNIDASQVAKDLSYVNISGKTRVGYDVSLLTKELEKFLGFANRHNAFLFGVGNLGGALIQDSGLAQYGLTIIAGFPERCRQTKTEIGILTLPVEFAQRVAEQMINGGIKAIWNFTPYRIRVPEDIIVQNTSIYSHLALMFNRLSAMDKNK